MEEVKKQEKQDQLLDENEYGLNQGKMSIYNKRIIGIAVGAGIYGFLLWLTSLRSNNNLTFIGDEDYKNFETNFSIEAKYIRGI